MSNLKAIRRRISSVRNTKQITKAMKLVSASKLRRAQEAAVDGRFFSTQLARLLGTVILDAPVDFVHELIIPRSSVEKRRVISIAGERGLCGAFNANVVKAIISEVRENTSVAYEHEVFGHKMVAAAKGLNWPVVRAHEGLGEDVRFWPLAKLCEDSIDDFMEGRCDEVVLYYTRFESVVTQHVVREVILPLDFERVRLDADKSSADLDPPIEGMTKYHPSADEVLSYLLPLIITSKLRQAAMDSKASEHAARMRAMDSATRNADELMSKLTLFYNRERQRVITTELIDIVGGAEAIK